MLSQFIEIGDKIELQPLERRIMGNVGGDGQKVYYSTLHDILSEDKLEITMPIEKAKLILLPVDSEYDLVFYANGGLYQCFVRVVDRYKSNNVYILSVELISNLRKYQRREYYRLNCALEMCVRTLTEVEIRRAEARDAYEFNQSLPVKKSVIADISGGGLRFLSSLQYEAGSLLYCSFELIKDNQSKKYEVVGKVLAMQELETRPGTYEHRVQYQNIDEGIREEIIKYIFEEERKSLKKERFL